MTKVVKKKMVDELKEGIRYLTRSVNKTNELLNYLEVERGMSKFEVLSILNNPIEVKNMKLTEMLILAQKVMELAYNNKNWLTDYYSEQQIQSINGYKKKPVLHEYTTEFNQVVKISDDEFIVWMSLQDLALMYDNKLFKWGNGIVREYVNKQYGDSVVKIPKYNSQLITKVRSNPMLNVGDIILNLEKGSSAKKELVYDSATMTLKLSNDFVGQIVDGFNRIYAIHASWITNKELIGQLPIRILNVSTEEAMKRRTEIVNPIKEEKAKQTKVEIFNIKMKKEFIQSFKESDVRRRQLIRIFKLSYNMEKELNTDICDMSISQIEEVIRGMAFRTLNSATRDVGLVNMYLGWCHSNDLMKEKEVKLINNKQEYINTFVNANLNEFYTKDVLYAGFKKIKRQYRLICELLFEGIGAKEFEEIQYLKVDQLIEKHGKFYVSLPRMDIEIPEQLFNELLLYNEVIRDSQMKTDFVPTNYIFKPLDTVKKHTVISHHYKTYALRELKEVFKDQGFNTHTIIKSGIRYNTFKLIENNNGHLSMDMVRYICDRYDKDKNVSGGYFVYRFMQSLRIDKMMKHYGEFTIEEELEHKI